MLVEICFLDSEIVVAPHMDSPLSPISWVLQAGSPRQLPADRHTGEGHLLAELRPHSVGDSEDRHELTDSLERAKRERQQHRSTISVA